MNFICEEVPRTRAEAKAAGVKQFFNGNPCKRGHVTARLVANGACLNCHNRSGRVWRAENPIKAQESVSKGMRLWREANKDRCEEYRRLWDRANPEKYLARMRNRRARKRSAEGVHTADDVSIIRSMQKDRCASCRTKVNGKGHVDHVRPLSKGGSNWPSNLQILCSRCNLSKGSKDPIDFSRSRGLLI
jgi:5-methylcytosine-specific restriction endonuclease McrA